MKIVFIGAPGSGKGTQGKLLAGKLNIPHVSTGDIFRDHMARQTDLGKEIDEIMNSGQLVPDALTISIVGNRLMEPDARSGYILDGFPRTYEQARDFNITHKIDVALFLQVPPWTAKNRLLARGRYDDSEEIIERRLIDFGERISAISNYYSDLGVLKVIRGSGRPEDIHEDILRILGVWY